jgi:hypothetical protein
MSAAPDGLYSVFENGWVVGSGSSAWLARCPRDQFTEADIRPACSTADAALGLHREALEPPRGVWLGEWQVEVTQDTDAQGWRYGASFAVFLEGGCGFGTSVAAHNPFLARGIRRRRWVRRYGPLGTAGAAAGPGARIAATATPAAAGAAVAVAAAPPAAAAAAASVLAAAPATAPSSAARAAAASPPGAARAPSPAPPPPMASSAAAAARLPLPLSPPPSAAARADPAAALLEALRSGLPLRTGAEAEQLTPAAVTADLEALNKLLQVLRRAVGLVQRAAAAPAGAVAAAAPPAAPQTLTSASLARGAQEMALRLRALEGICKARSGGGGGGGGGSGGSAWLRLSGQCASLLRQVGDEVARMERPLPARPAAGGRGGSSSSSGSGSGGSSGASSHAVAAAAAAAQVEAQQMLQAQAQMSEAEWALQDAEERERDILQIAKEVSEVADMFKDLNALVVTQGEAIERIEERAVEAAEHAKKGVEEVREANRKQRHSQACAIA